MAMMCKKCKGKGPFKRMQNPETGEVVVVCAKCGTPVDMPAEGQQPVAGPQDMGGPMSDGRPVEE